MSIVKINVIEVPEGRGEVLEQRFAARAGEVETVDGFESFDLLRPTEGTDRYLVVTKWRDEASFRAWMESESFQRGHAQGRPPAAGSGGDADGSAPSADHATAGDAPAHGHAEGGETPDQRPAAVGSELWGFEVVTSATGQHP